MNTKYYTAITVATTLISMKKDYDLYFKVDRYNEKGEYFRLVLVQRSLYKDNKAEEHIVMINWSSYTGYEVWSDQINPSKDLGDGIQDYNDVKFDDAVKMFNYIHDLLQLYGNKLGKEA